MLYLIMNVMNCINLRLGFHTEQTNVTHIVLLKQKAICL